MQANYPQSITFPQSVTIVVNNGSVRITQGTAVYVFYHNVPRLYSIGYSYSARTFKLTLLGINQEVSILIFMRTFICDF
jgi:hypothetical protein